MTENTRLCDRCLREFMEGRGLFFEVRLEAVADPTPPVLDDDQSVAELRAEYQRLRDGMAEVSAQEALDQVQRRQVFTLCNGCFESWFDHPFGEA